MDTVAGGSWLKFRSSLPTEAPPCPLQPPPWATQAQLLPAACTVAYGAGASASTADQPEQTQLQQLVLGLGPVADTQFAVQSFAAAAGGFEALSIASTMVLDR